MSPAEVLKDYWGFEGFRPMQEEIITAAIGGKDVLAILPTGGGKSVCFQVPGLMAEGVTLVVTPLIALMKDQVHNLEIRGIRADADRCYVSVCLSLTKLAKEEFPVLAKGEDCLDGTNSIQKAPGVPGFCFQPSLACVDTGPAKEPKNQTMQKALYKQQR